MYAPIVVFAFNRLDSLRGTIESLLANTEARESHLFVFVDGPRKEKGSEQEKVAKVQEYVKSIRGFQAIDYSFHETNQGLGPSIIEGVSKVFSKYGEAIVLEDDLIVSTNFLSYMNQGLDKYRNEPQVFSICGYSNTVSVPTGYQADAYFCPRSSSWGWATWKDRWRSVNWELKPWNDYKKYSHLFNKWGGSDCWGMLEGWHDGKNKSWAIRFCFAQFLQNKVSLFPIISKVSNNGFDGQGTNCKKWSRFRFIFDTGGSKTFVFPMEININRRLLRSALSYHSLWLRAWSKLMYIVYK